MLLPKRLAVFRIGLHGHNRLTRDIRHQHEDLAAHLEDVPVGSEGMLQRRTRELVDTCPRVLLQVISDHAISRLLS